MMRILDKKGNEIENPDLELGHLETETITIHHDATEPIPAKFHMEVIWPKGASLDYDGAKLLKKVVDFPYVPGHAAYDTEETIQRYIPYTKKELADIAKQKEEQEAQAEADRIAAEEAAQAAAEEEAAKAAKQQAIEAFAEVGPTALAELAVTAAEQKVQIEEQQAQIESQNQQLVMMQNAVAELAVYVANSNSEE